MEIDQKRQGNVQELHVTDDLGLVNRQDFLHGFEFQEQTALNQYAKLQCFLEANAFVLNGDLLLSGGANPSKFQFVHQAFLVDAFQ